MEITSLEQLKNIQIGQVVELPKFEDGTPFIARVKKPNMFDLMKSKKIPNTLLNVAMKVFKEGTGDLTNEALKDSSKLVEMFDFMQVMAENTLVEPSFKDLNEVGVQLNEMQLIALLNFSQEGVKGLEPFRPK